GAPPHGNSRRRAEGGGGPGGAGPPGGGGAPRPRPPRPRPRRRGARRRPPLARQAPLGHRLSRQGHAARGETLVNASAFIRRAGSRALIALVAGAGLALAAPAARAMTIGRVVSPRGIQAGFGA